MRNLKLMIIVVAVTVAANAAPMKPGKWQITVDTRVSGMDISAPPVTMSECVTDEEAASPAPPKTDPNSDCTVGDYKLNGNVVTWTIACPKEELKGDGTITFNGDSYDGLTKLKIGDTDVTQKLTGKYVGACEK